VRQNLLKGLAKFAGGRSKLCWRVRHTLLICLGSYKDDLLEGGNKKVLSLEETTDLPSRCSSRAGVPITNGAASSPTLDKPQGRARAQRTAFNPTGCAGASPMG